MNIRVQSIINIEKDSAAVLKRTKEGEMVKTRAVRVSRRQRERGTGCEWLHLLLSIVQSLAWLWDLAFADMFVTLSLVSSCPDLSGIVSLKIRVPVDTGSFTVLKISWCSLSMSFKSYFLVWRSENNGTFVLQRESLAEKIQKCQ